MSSGHPANKPYTDSMPVHRLRRRSGTKSTLPMPIRRVYLIVYLGLPGVSDSLKDPKWYGKQWHRHKKSIY